MAWSIWLTAAVRQRIKRLPKHIDEAFQLLLAEMKLSGPVQPNWPNYGKLREDCHHCHLKKGRPTYVAVWRVLSNKEKVIEVSYVGTHERAHYGRLC